MLTLVVRKLSLGNDYKVPNKHQLGEAGEDQKSGNESISCITV